MGFVCRADKTDYWTHGTDSDTDRKSVRSSSGYKGIIKTPYLQDIVKSGFGCLVPRPPVCRSTHTHIHPHTRLGKIVYSQLWVRTIKIEVFHIPIIHTYMNTAYIRPDTHTRTHTLTHTYTHPHTHHTDKPDDSLDREVHHMAHVE